MKQGHPSIVVGLDVGDRTSHVYALDFATGEVLSEGPVTTSPAAIRKHFARLPRARVALETGTHSRWLSTLFQEMGHEALVADARRLRLIYASTNKQDRLDARRLALLARVEPRLLYPVRHRGERAHIELAVVKARAHLVQQRAGLINAIRGMVKAVGGRLPRSQVKRFASRMARELPEALLPALEPLRKTIEVLDVAIADFDRRMEQMIEECHPEVRTLTQVPGVGNVVALTYVLTLDDPGRFRKSREVGPAIGLVPRRAQSGGMDPQLRITKTGNVYLRSLLVEAAQTVLRTRSPDTDLKRWGLRIAERGGRAAKKKAVIAVARRLAVLLHRLWVTGAKYEPLRNAAA